MKKSLLLVTLISSTQLIPEWKRHEGFLGNVFNTAENIAQVPIDIAEDVIDYPYYNDNYGDDYGYTHRRYKYQKNNSERKSLKKQTSKKSTDPLNKTTIKKKIK